VATVRRCAIRAQQFSQLSTINYQPREALTDFPLPLVTDHWPKQTPVFPDNGLLSPPATSPKRSIQPIIQRFRLCYPGDLLQNGFPMNYIFAFALGIGFAAGLRALTPPAVMAWAAHLGWLNLNNSPLAFMGSIITAVIFSLLAAFELIGDVRPSTPKRTAPVPLVVRILMGGLCGACICVAANQSLIIGAILGAVGGVIGAFAGYEIRRRLVTALNIKDIFIALLEDLVTIGLAYFFARPQ
jgi:uncharacterized membrane protein